MTDRLYCDECGQRLVNGRCMSCGIDYSSGTPVRVTRPARPVNPAGITAQAPSTHSSPSTASAPAQQPTYITRSVSDPKNMLISSDEHVVANLGSSYTQNFFSSGMVRSSYAVVSNKRLYFKGTMMHMTGAGVSRLNKMQISKIVDLADITGTCILTLSNIGLIISAVIAFVFAAASLCLVGVSAFFWIGLVLFGLLGGLMIMLYFKLRTKFMCIEYAGGDITFDLSMYRGGECEEFFKQLRIAKDRLVSEGTSVSQRV